MVSTFWLCSAKIDGTLMVFPSNQGTISCMWDPIRNDLNHDYPIIRIRLVKESHTPDPNAVLPIQRFVEGFVARLVENGWSSISPKDPETGRALSSVVETIDEWVEEFNRQNVEWERVAPWVQLANGLRPSSLGRIENWEHQLRLAQDFLVRVSDPDYYTVDLSISTATAQHELNQFSAPQLDAIDIATATFLGKTRVAA